jgi:hypothetical protein
MTTNGLQKQNKVRSYVLGLLFFAAFIVSCPLSIRLHDAETVKEVSSANREQLQHFSVLVITPERADILSLREVQELAKTNPSYSFLVPQGKELFYQQRLNESFKGDASPKFEVEQISPERQKIKLGMYGDGQTVSWYEVTDKEVFPKMEQNQGPMDAIVPALYSLVASIGIAIFVFVVWKVYGSRKQPAR